MAIPFKKYYDLLETYMRPFKRKVAALSTIMLIDIGIRILNPQIIRYYIDQVTTQASLQSLTVAAGLYIGFAIIGQFLVIFSVYLSQSISWGSTNLLRSDILNHTMRLDMDFHHVHKPGDMIERVDGDVNALSNFFSQLVLQVLSNILLIIGILIALFIEGFIIGLVFTIFTVGGLILAYFARKIAVPHFKAFREANAQLFGYIEERISGTEDLRSLGATPNTLKRFYDHERTRYNDLMRAITVSRLISVVFTGLIGFGITLVFIVGIPLFQSGQISIGTIFLLNFYVQTLVFPIFEILRQLQTLQEADASIERIEELFALNSALDEEGTLELNDEASIHFNDVTFAYFEDKDVLKHVSFSIKNGEKLGLIGRTGSGKTTISRLLFRLYDISNGEITINDIPIKDYNINDLRNKIGLVTQDVQLFNTSIRNNITFFDHSVSDETIVEIVTKLGLKNWIDKLEKGLDTRISADDISAGQAQLIAVGRVFLKQPSLIILDEASSRLDPTTEQLLTNALNELTAQRTTIIIAHRLATLETVDSILELSFGEIIEYGDRAKLRADPNSSYSKLIETGEEVLYS